MTLLFRHDTTEGNYTLAFLVNFIEIGNAGAKANLCFPFPKEMPTPILEIEKSDSINDCMYSGPWLSVSSKLKAIFEKFEVSAEFVKADVFYGGKPLETPAIYICNYLDAVDCMDFEQSEFEETPCGVTGVQKLVINDDKTKGHHFFCIGPIAWGHTPNPRAVRDIIVCVSEDFAAECVSQGIVGCVFCEAKHLRVVPVPQWHPAN